jgi:hypothetical protein
MYFFFYSLVFSVYLCLKENSDFSVFIFIKQNSDYENLLFILFLLIFLLDKLSLSDFDTDIEIIKRRLKLSLTGGFNSPQFSTINR